MRGTSSILLIAGVASLLATGAVEAAAPSGVEFQINTHTAGTQRFPAVGMDADGDFVVVWHSMDLEQPGDDWGVFAQRFDSSGVPQGGEFVVNTNTAYQQRYARVARLAAGAFVVVWDSVGQDGHNAGVFGARFDSGGTRVGGDFQVNAFTGNDQRYPAVAAGGDGGFVVVWVSVNQDGSGVGVFASRFDASATRLGNELQVNVFTTGGQQLPDVAVDSDGSFVVTWQSAAQDGDNQGVFARRFDAAGAPLGVEFQVSTYTTGAQQQARVAFDSDGDFLITWSDPKDGGFNGVFARRWNDAGMPQGEEFQVNTYTFGSQQRSVVAFDAGGGFVIAWQDFAKEGSFSGVFARRFDSTGAAETPEFQVNTYTPFYQQMPALAMAGDGDFVVVWQSTPQDGDTDGIFGQLYQGLSVYDFDGDGSTDALTDGLLLLRYFFGFRGATLTTGAVGAGCTRCDAATIEAFIEAHL